MNPRGTPIKKLEQAMKQLNELKEDFNKYQNETRKL
jgi:hypothetical protein